MVSHINIFSKHSQAGRYKTKLNFELAINIAALYIFSQQRLRHLSVDIPGQKSTPPSLTPTVLSQEKSPSSISLILTLKWGKKNKVGKKVHI